MSVTLIEMPSPMRRRIAGMHSGVAGTLMKTFGRPSAAASRFASATVFSVSPASEGRTSREIQPSTGLRSWIARKASAPSAMSPCVSAS